VNAPGLSVVIPSRDGAGRLAETLASIARQAVTAPVEVVVVDDGSADGTLEVARRAELPWGAAKVRRHDTGRGRAAACNTGLEAAESQTVLILDDDMTVEPGALEAHLRFHRRTARRCALGRIVMARGPEDSSFLRFLVREQQFGEAALLARRDDVPFSLCLTGHFSAPRAALVEVGGFDASIARYGFEDIELGYRLGLAGVGLSYVPEAVSIHRAYMTDLNRYLARQREAGLVARQLAARYPDGPFREYLRVEGPRSLGIGAAPTGLVALRLANRLLLVPPVRRLVGSAAGFWALRGLLAATESAGLDRLTHFGYHVARDVRYFQGCFDDRPEQANP
jgi:glycosyltransferase involved in cell wall biosynthesis